MKTFFKASIAALALFPALPILADSTSTRYCQFLDGHSKGYLCVPRAELDYPKRLLLIYNGDIDRHSARSAQFVTYSPLPATARIEAFVDGRRVFWGTRSVGQRFWVNGIYAESRIEINIYDTDRNYIQFIRLDPLDVRVGYESGGIGVWAGR